MIKYFFTFLFLHTFAIVFGQFNLTFTVDLSENQNFNPSLHQVYVSGAVQNSNQGIAGYPAWPMPGTNENFLMTSNEDTPTLFEVTFSSVEPGAYAYKYFLVANNNASWNLGEWGGTDNRVIIIENEDVTTQDTWGVMNQSQEINLIINEFMASNGNTLLDNDGDNEDWIEIYNAGNEPVNLNGFGLSDDEENPMRWTFPSMFILPNEYLIVWASGKNRSQYNQPLHTNFSISSSGEPILLSDNEGNLLDFAPSVQHQTDISFGRLPNATGDFAYLSNATPGSANEGPSFQSLSTPVEFSHQDGYYSNSIAVSLSSNDNNTEIRYTLNGDEPSEDSPLYTEPLIFDNLSDIPNQFANIPTNATAPGPPFYEGWEPPAGNVYKINVLRAKAFSPDTPEAPPQNRTYIIDEQESNRYSLPVLSLTSDFAHLFDHETGMYVYGNSGNFWEDWERPGNFTLFEKDGTFGFNENAGYQLNGNTTRNRPRKSVRMVFRGEYGNSWLNYPIFENKDTEQYKRLILRNGGNDWGNTLIRDGVAQILAKDFNVETQYFKPLVMFINGEYWGIHNLRDRYSTHYFEAKYGIESQELTVMENNAAFKRGNPAGSTHYQNLISFIQNNDLAEAENYNTVSEMMDIESFIDFQLTHIYPKNTDWPGNNVMYWRYLRDDFDPTAGVRDGRWRWLIFDLDFAFDLDFNYVPHLQEGASHNTLAFAMQENGPAWPNPDWSTLLLRKLTDNEAFTHKFVNRYCDLLNTVYKADFVENTIDSVKNILLPEMPEHIERWRRPVSVFSWLAEIEEIKTFVQARTDYQFEHLQSVFNLGEKRSIEVNVNDEQAGWIKINSIDLKAETNGISENVYPWVGYYIEGAPIQLVAKPKPGYTFSHWSGAAVGANPSIELNLGGNQTITAHFSPISEEDYELMHYWFFGNNLANNTPLLEVAPTFSIQDAEIEYISCLPGYPYESGHPNWRKASMERRNAPTTINYTAEGNNNIEFGNANMRGLQIRQPFRFEENENTVLLNFSTLGHNNIIVRFAAINEGAASGLIIDYKNPELSEDFSTEGIISEYSLTNSYQLFEINLNNAPAANNSENFILRIRFSGNNLTEDNGNRVTFNNMSVSGTPLEVSIHEVRSLNTTFFSVFPNPAKGQITLKTTETIAAVDILDSTGKLAAQFGSPENKTLNICNLKQGLYIVRAQFLNGKIGQAKFIKTE
jgi:uncharacterized repeat protein (TIGR02543 family)